MQKSYRSVALSLLVVLTMTLSACMGGGRAPVYTRGAQDSGQVEQKPVAQRSIPGTKSSVSKPNTLAKKGYYQVVPGDTMYSIAWRYQLDYKKLASWNSIRSPYLIKVGKKLRLTPPAVKPSKVATNKPKPQTRPPVTKPKPPTTIQTTAASKLVWQWPAKGKLISSNTVSARNGIDIKGKVGQPIKAAANGKVVYSGNGLVGYGNLIIIKHNKSFLSAYAHNNQLLVPEGTTVKRGQAIAEMGNTGTNQVKLHFEIRRDGKSVNPKDYLP